MIATGKNVNCVIEKMIPHISCYALTVEPSTALNTMILQGKKAAVDADRQANQFLLLMDWMEQAGYQHYESAILLCQVKKASIIVVIGKVKRIMALGLPPIHLMASNQELEYCQQCFIYSIT
jgi:hypothetical protein